LTSAAVGFGTNIVTPPNVIFARFRLARVAAVESGTAADVLEGEVDMG